MESTTMYSVLLILMHILHYYTYRGIYKYQGILHVFKLLYYTHYSAISYLSYIMFDIYTT